MNGGAWPGYRDGPRAMKGGISVRGAVRRCVRSTVVAANGAVARGARSYPSVDMAKNGFVVQNGFLAGSQCDAVLADVVRFGDRTLVHTGVTGASVRDRADRQQRDLNVRQLVGAQHLTATLDSLYRMGRIERTLSQLTGLSLAVRGMTVQIDWPDTCSKRGLHVDSHWPPTYKAFIYLTPVLGAENGPFSVVAGSHRHRARKIRAVVGNYAHRRVRTDVDSVYSMTEAQCLLGGPGTAIFADQRLAHAGWPEHTVGTRFMIVAYLYETGLAPPGFLR